MSNGFFAQMRVSNMPPDWGDKIPKNENLASDFSEWCTSILAVSPSFVRQKLQMFLEEDHGGGCATLIACSDLASASKSPQKQLAAKALACIVAKDDFVICGLQLMCEAFRLASDGHAKVFTDVQDGALIKKGQILLSALASPSQLLLAERVALNLSSHLSGITSFTANVVAKISAACAAAQTKQPDLLETRKTTPGLRVFEKYATRLGGARNHRHSLDTGAMLKENHLRTFGGVQQSLQKCLSGVPLLTKVEIEVSNLTELAAALNIGADVVMLDNFKKSEVEEAVSMRARLKSTVQFELSGNLDRKDLGQMCTLGVDFLSMGALIHQSTWVDMSMQLFLIESLST
jgi:nicotinate-nucleotide pyrophosphorylase (carboxylating)